MSGSDTGGVSDFGHRGCVRNRTRVSDRLSTLSSLPSFSHLSSLSSILSVVIVCPKSDTGGVSDELAGQKTS